MFLTDYCSIQDDVILHESHAGEKQIGSWGFWGSMHDEVSLPLTLMVLNVLGILVTGSWDKVTPHLDATILATNGASKQVEVEKHPHLEMHIN